jgi:hypothetical protein
MEFTKRKAGFYLDTGAVKGSLIETEVTIHYWVI